MHSIGRTSAVLAALVVVVAACSDDDAATSSTVAPTTTSSAATTPPSTAPTPAEEDDSGGVMADLIEMYEKATVRLTYHVGEGESQTTVVVAQDPSATPPIASIGVAEAGTRIIMSEGTTVMCDEAAGRCFELPGAEGETLTTALVGPFGSMLIGAVPGADVGPMAEEPITVAGRAGICLTHEPTGDRDAQTDLVRQCVDGELGFTLLLQTSDVGTDAIDTILELVEYGDPTPDDFELTSPLAPGP